MYLCICLSIYVFTFVNRIHQATAFALHSFFLEQSTALIPVEPVYRLTGSALVTHPDWHPAGNPGSTLGFRYCPEPTSVQIPLPDAIEFNTRCHT